MWLKRFPEHLAWDGPSDGRAVLRSLGTAGFTLDVDGHILAIDPFLTRPGLLTTAFARLEPHTELLQREIPRCESILVGHAHFDHALDAPVVGQLTGATVYGSESVANLCRAAGHDRFVSVTAGQRYALPYGEALPIASRHGRVYFNRVTLPGDIEVPPPWPPRMREMPHGPVLTWWARWGDQTILHVDSADYDTPSLEALVREGLHADTVCLCAIGRHYRPGYTHEILQILQPRRVVPCHFDWFFSPWGQSERLLPLVDLEGFIDEIRAEGPEVMLLRAGQRAALSAP
jgi:L-ascorbate metabolism protein UlaG (beta-lactamase superfamily)